MMTYIQQQNQNKSNIQIPLSGFAIGNGWIDSFHQFSSLEAAYGHGLLEREQINTLKEMERECQEGYRVGVPVEPPEVCDQVMNDVI
jgi:hypothetical protein